LELECGHLSLRELQKRLALEQRPYCSPIQTTVTLSPGRPDRWTFRPIQHPELDPRQVGRPTHDAPECIHLANNCPLGDSTYRRVAGHLPDRFQILGDE
jgi:hypothetical protein